VYIEVGIMKSHTTTKQPKHSPEQLLDDKRFTFFAVTSAILLVFGATVGMLLLTHNRSDAPAPLSPEAYKQQLQSQVQANDGSPNSGRDPASQGQTSLADAAAKPNGAGARTDTPASGVTGDNSTHASSSDVYGDASKTGINAAGCYIDYGIQGQECLPAHAAGDDGKLTCSEVRQHFPQGIKVTGTDRFSLDKNGDKTACGSGD
jgi:hypothetical protein